jgi:hypothetical protein
MHALVYLFDLIQDFNTKQDFYILWDIIHSFKSIKEKQTSELHNIRMYTQFSFMQVSKNTTGTTTLSF